MTNTQNTIAKLIIAACASLLITSCATKPILTLEEPVEQLNDLDDYDKDGVIAAREKCASTVLGATIDNNGCGTQTPIIVPFKIDIKFVNNDYSIPKSAHGKIKELAEFLDKNKDLSIRIEGHTSKVGKRSLNQTLSENRAEAVADVLVNDFNIAQQRVSSIGYSFDRLKEEGNTPEDHAINRRIIAELKATDHVDNMKWTIYTVNQEL